MRLIQRESTAACLLTIGLAFGTSTAADPDPPAEAWYKYYRVRASKEYELGLPLTARPA
ncbi:MAG: hypothetical protein H8E66_01200 [Planctomycetes bacterium]|nr:hypothetical protein [Planctomycetota bacterium]